MLKNAIYKCFFCVFVFLGLGFSANHPYYLSDYDFMFLNITRWIGDLSRVCPASRPMTVGIGSSAPTTLRWIKWAQKMDLKVLTLSFSMGVTLSYFSTCNVEA